MRAANPFTAAQIVDALPGIVYHPGYALPGFIVIQGTRLNAELLADSIRNGVNGISAGRTARWPHPAPAPGRRPCTRSWVQKTHHCPGRGPQQEGSWPDTQTTAKKGAPPLA